MKRAKNLFEKLVSDDNLLLAIDEVNRTHHWRTHHRPNSCTAWVEETKEERVVELRQIIIAGFEQKKPHVSQRWDASARKAIEIWMDKDPRGTKYEFCGDIRHFYDSLQPEVVMDRMRQLIKDRRVLDLIWRVVKDGVQIGAYTSQWFANTVLQPMDRLIRESGLCKHYVRYMDNLTIFGSSKRKLKKLRVLVETWLNAHQLRLKDDWQIFPTVRRHPRIPLDPPRRGYERPKERMPDAVGYRYGRGYTIPRKHNLLRIKRAIARYRKRRRLKKRILAGAAASLLSRLGQLKHCNNHNLYRMLFQGERLMRELKRIIRQKQRKEELTWNTYLERRAKSKSSKLKAIPTPT